jgi:hypothetical protein
MQVQILREAETELWEAVTEYEQIELGLGLRFKDEVQSPLLERTKGMIRRYQ